MHISFNDLRRYEKHLLRAMAFSIPISIGMTQIFYFAFLISSLPNFKKALKLKALAPLKSQLICWLVVMVVATFASVDFFRSASESIKGLSYPLFVVLILFFLESIEDSRERVAEIYQILLFLIIGQAIAAFVAVFSFAIGSKATFGLPGPVTASGQLALVLPIITGIMLGTRSQTVLSKQRLLALLVFLGFVVIVLARQLEVHYCVPIQILTLLLIAYLLRELYFFAYLKNFWTANFTQGSFLALSLLPVLMADFVFNLKRGPWLGVILATTFLGIILGKRKIILAIGGAGFAMLLIPSVRTRLLNVVADFTIAGGRERMWGLGIEIASRYPLGVGPKNAVYMRILDPYLPPGHRHLHNNLLNVVVEMGYLGGVIFVWWMATLVYLGFKWAKLASSGADPSIRRASLIAVSLSAAILSWQCAGLGEFNFGDAEIRMISFLLMGLLLSLNCYLEQFSNREPISESSSKSS